MPPMTPAMAADLTRQFDIVNALQAAEDLVRKQLREGKATYTKLSDECDAAATATHEARRELLRLLVRQGVPEIFIAAGS